MYRVLTVLLIFLLLTLGLATTSQAADAFPAIIAQIPNMYRGPGMYLNLFKFVPVVIVYLLWAWTTNWVEHDTRELNNLKFAVWNGVSSLRVSSG